MEVFAHIIARLNVIDSCGILFISTILLGRGIVYDDNATAATRLSFLHYWYRV